MSQQPAVALLRKLKNCNTVVSKIQIIPSTVELGAEESWAKEQLDEHKARVSQDFVEFKDAEWWFQLVTVAS